MASFTDFPKILAEYHPTRNATPLETYSPGSKVKVWWLASCGHEWEARIYSRARSEPTGCPFCSTPPVKVLQGFNDLGTTDPPLASQWHPIKNDPISPQDVFKNTNKKFWWLASCGHEWEASPNKRAQGRGCPVCSGHRVVGGFNDLSKDEHVSKLFHPTLNEPITLEQISRGSNKNLWWLCPTCANTWQAYVYNIAGNSQQGCPTCAEKSKYFVSQGENEVAVFIESLGFTVVRNTFTYTYPGSVDIFIPSHNLAIEFNGLYWHSESAGKTPRSHIEKLKKLHTNSISLLVVWEDDWKHKRLIIESMIKHKLGVSDKSTAVAARKTNLVELASPLGRQFLAINHIQGAAKSSLYFGLTDLGTGELVAVIAYKIQKNVAYLDRYATSRIVPGGFTRLLKHTIDRLKVLGVTKIVTFADSTVSQGALYHLAGFVEEAPLPPDYKYLYKKKRHHKFGFRKIRFMRDPNLVFKEGLTEKQLASLNNISRIWDYGKQKYVFHL